MSAAHYHNPHCSNAMRPNNAPLDSRGSFLALMGSSL